MEEKWLKIIYITIIVLGILITGLTILQNHFQKKLDKRLERERSLESGNPLFPLRIKCVFNIDYSKAKDVQRKNIEDFKNYVVQFIDRDSNPFKHCGIELPKENFVVRPDKIIYRNFKINSLYNTKLENIAIIQFEMLNDNFIKTILPEIYLSFLEKNDPIKKFKTNDSNLLLNLMDTSYNTEVETLIEYNLEFTKKKVRLELSVIRPSIKKNDGIIKSIYSCRNGWIGLGIQNIDSSGISFLPENITLSYGLDFKTETSISFRSEMKIENVKYNFMDYFFVQGKDVLNP